MSEFRPYGLFYDVLSGEFAPPSDPLHRRHTLARLAVATVQKGRGPVRERDYIPSWANHTYAVVTDKSGRSKPGQADSSLTISGIDGRWPMTLEFSDFRPMPANNRKHDHEFVITGRNGLEIVRPLELGNVLNGIRTEMVELAQDFYNHYPMND